MIKKQRILFIDDQRGKIEEFIDGLRDRNFDVRYYEDFREAFRWLHGNTNTIDCLILDVMMPTRSSHLLFETDDGMFTGLMLYSEAREMAPDLPIILFTNNTDSSLTKAIKDDRRTRLFLKFEFLYDEFADAVVNFLAETRAIGAH